MFCPKCAAQNVDGAKFCRACGEDIVAALQQLTGSLPDDATRRFDESSRAEEQTGIAGGMNEMFNSMFEDRDGKSVLRRPPRAPMAPMMQPFKRREKNNDGSTGKPADIGHGIQLIFFGVGFICASLGVAFFARGGGQWWFWMLIPAFLFLGGGVAEIVRARRAETRPTRELSRANSTQPAVREPPTPRAVDASHAPTHPQSYRPSTTEPLVEATPPPSVTEGTTRLLDPHGEKDSPS